MNDTVKVTGFILAFLATLLIAFFSSPQTVTVFPSHDAYVFDGNPNLGYGIADPNRLEVRKGGAGLTLRAWLMFDLGDIPEGITVTSVKLKLYCTYLLAGAEWNLAACFGDTNWHEYYLTWNNEPSYEQEFGILNAKALGDDAWYEWHPPVDRIQSILATTKKTAFVIEVYRLQAAKSVNVALFSSRDAGGDYQPRLIIGYGEEEAPPEYTYELSVTVMDQVGHLLPAQVTADTKQATCDKYGYTSIIVGAGTISVTAKITVGENQYNATESIIMDKDKSIRLIITRRFLWTFFIEYTDGTLATGTVYTSGKESLTIPITNGLGTAYLLDGLYSFSFESSPVDLGSITISNDGEFHATLNKETGALETSTSTETPITSPISPVTTPEIPWLLIPSIYIYALLGVLVFGFIIAAVVRLRKPVEV